jgi:hypothetical protein
MLKKTLFAEVAISEKLLRRVWSCTKGEPKHLILFLLLVAVPKLQTERCGLLASYCTGRNNAIIPVQWAINAFGQF